MAQILRVRRGTAAEWTSANTVLTVGEIGFETDTNRLKVGDGATAWNSLVYLDDYPELVSADPTEIILGTPSGGTQTIGLGTNAVAFGRNVGDTLLGFVDVDAANLVPTMRVTNELMETGLPRLARLTSDVTVIANSAGDHPAPTVTTDITGMVVTVDAFEIVEFHGIMLFTGDTSADLKMRFNATSLSGGGVMVNAVANSVSTTPVGGVYRTWNAFNAQIASLGLSGTGVTVATPFTGIAIGGFSQSTIQILAAQQTAHSSDLVAKASSFMVATKIGSLL